MPRLNTETRPARDVDRLCALTNAMARHEAMVRRYVGALSGRPGDVDDLAQEVFLRAMERLDRLHSDDHLPRFLRGIARLVVREHARRRRRDLSSIDADCVILYSSSESAHALCEREESIRLLRNAIETLPLVARRMLEMCYAEGLTAQQIGTALDIRPGAVRVSLLRIRERLRKALTASS